MADRRFKRGDRRLGETRHQRTGWNNRLQRTVHGQLPELPGGLALIDREEDHFRAADEILERHEADAALFGPTRESVELSRLSPIMK